MSSSIVSQHLACRNPAVFERLQYPLLNETRQISTSDKNNFFNQITNFSNFTGGVSNKNESMRFENRATPGFALAETARLRFPRTKRRLPQCIIIGARKCGTRALLEFLNLHPMIQKATEEIHFFDDDEKYALGLDWYRRRMPYSFPGQITVEKSPAYFITPSVPARIRQMNPSVKLLLIVRDPVTRLISDYAQLASNKARKERSLASFEDLVLTADGSVNLGYKAVRIGIYSLFFPRWLRTFSREQIHIVDGDNLIVDPFQEIQKIENFLGLGHRVLKKNFYYNETKGFFCVRNATADKCLNDSKGRKHPNVSSEIIRTLRMFYAPHNQHFFKQTGVTFNWPTE
ncbi:heparan sulfate glucosamine 3-O-sulfotransferase 5 [Trichonephila clavipes]|nr:heparan sulfate glucosamine 3-O-sulfotransferase 5 [Trichonephila clavipes]